MTSSLSPAAALDPAALVADLERRGQRFETPCEGGSLVWHSWGSGPPLLLMHGAQGSWTHFIRNIDALAEQRTLWVPDIPGFGDSAMPAAIDHAAIARVIAAGKRELVGPDPIDVVGFSFGGILSAYMSVYEPDVARRLILVDTGGLDTPMGEMKMHRVRGLEGAEREAALRANLLIIMLYAPASVDALALHVQQANIERARMDVGKLCIPNRLEDILGEVTIPLDAIWGAHDHPHPDPHVQEAALRRFHPALNFRVVPDAGHWVMYENAAGFNRTVIDLLKA